MIYLEPSALVTMVAGSRYADALRRFFADHSTERTSTSVREHKEIRVTRAVRDLAACLPGSLRTLDALHVASAEQFGPELTALVTYDKRMAEVARQRGLPVVMPGME